MKFTKVEDQAYPDKSCSCLVIGAVGDQGIKETFYALAHYTGKWSFWRTGYEAAIVIAWSPLPRIDEVLKG